MFRRRPALIDPRSSAARTGALLAVGAYAVHELRYAIALGEQAPHVLEHHGHSYMSAVAPIVGLVLAIALGSWITAIARAHRDRSGEVERRGLGAAWLASSASLFGIFAMQETLEGLLSPGHLNGAAAVLGGGGWTALPLALLFGAVLALLLRGARAVTRRAAAYSIAPVWRTVPRPVSLRPMFGFVLARPRLGLIACNQAGRAPPAVS